MTDAAAAQVPSWKRWPPNCCESCVGWARSLDGYSPFTGTCVKDNSIDFGTTTDSRYRCPSFQRKEGI
jgi:hypothetical protein